MRLSAGERSLPQRPRNLPAHRAADGAVPALVQEVLASPGRPLDVATRDYMESRFGHDFSRVRVHTDGKAAESARVVGALAYTVGRDVVFASGRYSPAWFEGKRLLAHELAHTVQQTGAAASPHVQLFVSTPGDPFEQEADRAAKAVSDGIAASIRPAASQRGLLLMRTWDAARPGDCRDVASDVWLEKVVVEQEQPQSVTLHWSNGHLNSSLCSTGKGHCCVGPATAEGTACPAPESRRSGSNCTPITEGRGYTITDRYVSYNGWDFWNTFVPHRGIGLHQHPTVTGAPLSHGCVRLPRDTARLIFCGSRQRRTRVEVRGFARPNCADPDLQAEWRSDFASAAARVTDGESSEARRMLREAYGRRLSEAEITGGLGVLDIPRCVARAALPTLEERRLLPASPAGAANPTVPVRLIVSGGFEPQLPAFTGQLATARNFRRARQIVLQHGRDLWQLAARRAQAGDTDDRPVYWARLQMARALRQWQPGFRLTGAQGSELLDVFERASRGMETAAFGTGTALKRILISGFDVFGLERARDITRGNPSGAAALALDGRRIRSGAIEGEVQAVIFPVRFADFDRGIAERLFRPFLTGPGAVDMIMTVSQGISPEFEVEEYAGRRRSSEAVENVGVTGGGTPQRPVVPPGLAPGPEFLRTTLPRSVRGTFGRTAPTAEETEVVEIPAGGTGPVRRPAGPTPGTIAVAGSGGGYISNEIFYRVSLLRLQESATIPVGHLHTPLLDLPQTGITTARFEAARTRIVSAIERVLIAALPDL